MFGITASLKAILIQTSPEGPFDFHFHIIQPLLDSYRIQVVLKGNPYPMLFQNSASLTDSLKNALRTIWKRSLPQEP